MDVYNYILKNLVHINYIYIYIVYRLLKILNCLFNEPIMLSSK